MWLCSMMLLVAMTNALTVSGSHRSFEHTSKRAFPQKLSGPGFRFLGRVNPTTRELTWPGTGVSFTFTGSSASIRLAAISGNSSVDLIIDGGAPIVIPNVTGSAITTPTGLSRGNHSVVLRKRSEASFGSITIGNISSDGALAVDVAPTRQLEIVGDSITVGYGLDGVNPCTNNASVENNPKTYAALAADALHADYNIVAWSGRGILRNYPSGSADESALMPELYTRYGANDADNSYTFPSTWKPNAVVINLGTNDFAYLNARAPLNATDFTAGMVKFVRRIQTHYPASDYFLLTSPMLNDDYPTAADAQKTTQTNALKNAILQLNSTKFHLVEMPTQGSDVGCDYHPNAATHAAESKILVSAISQVLGW